MKFRIWSIFLFFALFLSVYAGGEIIKIPVEAEDFKISYGWKVIKDKQGYFPSLPNLWSRNRLYGDLTNNSGLAWTKISIPETGDYKIVSKNR